MTREEKLQKAHQMFDDRELLIELKWQREYFKRGYVSSQEELFNLWIFDECIKALQKPCEDAISRQAVLEVLKDKWNMFSDANDAMQESIGTIEALPNITPQPKTGHWIKPYGGNWHCDKCDYEQGRKSNFCPDCGAKMVESQESEDKENE
jgi:hypothetical protein